MPEAYRCLWSALDGSKRYHQEFVTLNRSGSSFAEYCRNCADFVRKLARTQYLFLSDASDLVSCLPLSSKTTVVQLWHACGAFKRFGMSTADSGYGLSRSDIERHPFYENLSLVTVSSPEVVWAYEEAMGLEGAGAVRALGVSRTDAFFDERQLGAWRTEVARAVPQVEGQKVLLYAPTFRGQVTDPVAPDCLDVARLHELLGDGWVVLLKHHPFVRVRPAIPVSCADFAFDVTDTLPIEACMAAADVCVTDYSSLVFEWSLLRKPLAFLVPDREEYDDRRGVYYDFDELVPGPTFCTTDELGEWAVRAEDLYDFERLARFRDRFMSACDGHATERIANAALSSEV
jgi:CDP-ribitol ribitolphosphotransferase